MAPTLFISDLHLSRGAARAGRGIPCLARAGRRAKPPRCTCWATCSTPGSATISCASRWRPRSPPRSGRQRGRGVRVYLQRGNRDFLLGRALRACRRRHVAARRRRPRPARHADAADARRSAVHRRRRNTSAIARGGRIPRTGGACWRCRMFVRRGIARAAAQAPAVAPTRASRRRSWMSTPTPSPRRCASIGVVASDSRPHASPGAARARSSTTCVASAGCSPTGTTAAAICVSSVGIEPRRRAS